MASPQLEDGYIKIANEIAEALMTINLSAYESRVLWFIFRKTYGFQKKTDWLSLSQFSDLIGLDRRLVHRAIKGLLSKGMLVIERDDGQRVKYGFQKDYTKWIKDTIKPSHGKKIQQIKENSAELSSKGMMSSKGMTTVIERDDELSSKGILTKETITKEIKDPPYPPKMRTAKTQKADEGFDLFWAAYPKKRDKVNALKAWRKLNGTRPPVEAIVRSINNQKRSADWIKDEGQFIPYPATWLNGQRWEDEIYQPTETLNPPSRKVVN